jgi:hypothetical protein
MKWSVGRKDLETTRKEAFRKEIFPLSFQCPFTPLESPSIYAGDGEKRKQKLLIEGRFKTLPFLTGFTNIL